MFVWSAVIGMKLQRHWARQKDQIVTIRISISRYTRKDSSRRQSVDGQIGQIALSLKHIEIRWNQGRGSRSLAWFRPPRWSTPDMATGDGDGGAARARAAAYHYLKYYFHLFSFCFHLFLPGTALLMLVLDISGCLLSSVLAWNEIWTYLMKLNETRHNYTIQSGNSRYALTQPWHLPSVPHHFTWTWRKYASTKHATGLVPAVGRSSSICSYKPWFNIQYVAKRDFWNRKTQQAIDQTRRTTSFYIFFTLYSFALGMQAKIAFAAGRVAVATSLACTPRPMSCYGIVPR